MTPHNMIESRQACTRTVPSAGLNSLQTDEDDRKIDGRFLPRAENRIFCSPCPTWLWAPPNLPVNEYHESSFKVTANGTWILLHAVHSDKTDARKCSSVYPCVCI